MKEYTPIPCLICGKKLRQIDSGSFNHPDDAVIFKSHGNYGSTVYDPMSDSEYVEVNVCDECFTKKGKHILHVRLVSRGHDEYKYQPYDEALKDEEEILPPSQPQEDTNGK